MVQPPRSINQKTEVANLTAIRLGVLSSQIVQGLPEGIPENRENLFESIDRGILTSLDVIDLLVNAIKQHEAINALNPNDPKYDASVAQLAENSPSSIQVAQHVDTAIANAIQLKDRMQHLISDQKEADALAKLPARDPSIILREHQLLLQRLEAQNLGNLHTLMPSPTEVALNRPSQKQVSDFLNARIDKLNKLVAKAIHLVSKLNKMELNLGAEIKGAETTPGPRGEDKAGFNTVPFRGNLGEIRRADTKTGPNGEVKAGFNTVPFRGNLGEIRGADTKTGPNGEGTEGNTCVPFRTNMGEFTRPKTMTCSQDAAKRKTDDDQHHDRKTYGDNSQARRSGEQEDDELRYLMQNDNHGIHSNPASQTLLKSTPLTREEQFRAAEARAKFGRDDHTSKPFHTHSPRTKCPFNCPGKKNHEQALPQTCHRKSKSDPATNQCINNEPNLPSNNNAQFPESKYTDKKSNQYDRDGNNHNLPDPKTVSKAPVFEEGIGGYFRAFGQILTGEVSLTDSPKHTAMLGIIMVLGIVLGIRIIQVGSGSNCKEEKIQPPQIIGIPIVQLRKCKIPK